jgi:hypothetical protein
MAQLFRFRRLSAGSDREVDYSGRSALGLLSAEAGAVHSVSAAEGEASFNDLLRMLREGQIAPSDLVFSEGRWLTFDAAPEFFEACEGIADPRKRAHTIKAVLLFFAAAAIFAVIVLLRIGRAGGWR